MVQALNKADETRRDIREKLQTFLSKWKVQPFQASMAKPAQHRMHRTGRGLRPAPSRMRPQKAESTLWLFSASSPALPVMPTVGLLLECQTKNGFKKSISRHRL
jgi:hypothetical protein